MSSEIEMYCSQSSTMQIGMILDESRKTGM